MVFAGMPLPVPYYAGGIRDTNVAEPELIGYGCQVNGVMGAHSSLVPSLLQDLEHDLQREVAALDVHIPALSRPTSEDQLDRVVELCAVMHGEWIRIHPFANGNGRVARLWVIFLALRYGLPLFLPIHPRPDAITYGGVCAIAMSTGDDRPTARCFRDLVLRMLEDA
jgi:hypothetical protein